MESILPLDGSAWTGMRSGRTVRGWAQFRAARVGRGAQTGAGTGSQRGPAVRRGEHAN